MKSDRLLAFYDRMAEAPGAVGRLRRFVLDLAVRGKLVPQDPADEPASELLKRIGLEKERQRLAKEIGSQRGVVPLKRAHVPFSPPSGWTWTQLAHLGLVSPRNEAPDALAASFVPMRLIRAEYGATHEQEIRPWGRIKEGYTHFAEGDVGLAKITPCFENGKSTVFRGLSGGLGSGTTELHVIRPILVSADYLVIFLKSPSFIEKGISRMTGTVGQKRVPREYFTSSPFPLPPLAEQRRIVAKVDELMALCDRLDTICETRERTRERLTGATYAQLLAYDQENEAFRAGARRTVRALPALTARSDQIKSLRKTILDLAVRGKLVPQDPGAVPVPRLLADRNIATSGTVALDIPCSWAWVDVGSVAKTRLGKMLDKAKNRGTPRRYLRNINVRWFDFDLTDVLEMRLEDSELEKFSLRSGDVLICEGGEPGRAAVWDERERDIYFQKAIHRVRFVDLVDARFFVKALRASVNDGRLRESLTGTGIRHFTGKELRAYAFPLPPLAEQRRIVAKVDELMALCDRLEAALEAASTARRQLLDSLLLEALPAA